ncbi:LysR family transcriptional regulator [Nocardia brasiliensis]
MAHDPRENRRDIDIDSLRYFLALGNSKSFRSAAESVGISQPGLKGHIDRIETALGLRLFYRSQRGAQLTSVGRQIYEQALRVAASHERLLEYAQHLAHGTEGVLSIACYPVHVERFLGTVLGRFHQIAPEVQIDLTQMRDDRRRGWGRSLFDELAGGEVDLAMGPPHADLGLDGIKAFEATIVAMVEDDHPNRHDSTMAIAALKDVPLLIAPESYFSRERVTAVAREAGFTLTIRAQSSSPPALLVLGRNGLGIPILPDDYPLVGQQRYPYPGIVDIHGRPISTEVWLQWRKDVPMSPAAEKLVQIAFEEIEQEANYGRRNECYYRADLSEGHTRQPDNKQGHR